MDRRLVLVLAAGAAAVLAACASSSSGSLSSGSGGSGSPGDGIVTSPPLPLPTGDPFAPNVVAPGPAVDLHPLAFQSVDSSPSSATLTLHFALAGGPAHQVLGQVDLRETADAVTVTLQVGRPPGRRARDVVPDLAFPAVTSVTLAAPLGTRRVVDGATRAPRRLYRPLRDPPTAPPVGAINTGFSTAYALSALVCSLMALAAWRRRATAGAAARCLVAVLAGLAWWSAVDLLSTAGTHAVRLDVQLAIYPGVALNVVGIVGLGRAMADPDWRPTRRWLRGLAVEPVLICAAAATNSWHHLVLAPSPHPPYAVFGPLFWAHAAYSYLLLATALWAVARRRREATALQSRQLSVLLLSALPPVVGNAVTLSGITGTYDVSALFFVLTGLLEAYAVFRLGLFAVVPVARALVLERLDDAVLVLDERRRLADLNAAARDLLARAVPRGRPELGVPAEVALGGLLPLTSGASGERQVELVEVAVAVPVALDVRRAPLLDGGGRHLGTVLVLRDVTEAARSRTALQQQLVTIEALRAELAEQAVRDPLTGLHNRRHLAAVLARQLAGQDEQEPVSVVLLDVDHFKAVNDGHGHAVGDDLLQRLAAAMLACARADDTVARYGGEEFVLLLPGTPAPVAAARAEEVRAACRRVLVPLPDGGTLHVTVSAGVADSTGGPTSADRLLEAADRALYLAKEAGRDRVVLAPAQPAGASTSSEAVC